MAISVFAFHKNNHATFGGKRQNSEKNLVENGKTFVFALKLFRSEQRKLYDFVSVNYS